MDQNKSHKAIPFGSIWWLLEKWVQERWKLRNPFCPGRVRHPILIVGQNARAGACESVPSLFGRTERHPAAFVVYGISSEYPSDHPTHFFDALHDLPSWMFKSSGSSNQPEITRQFDYCTALDSKEEAAFRQWLRSRVGRKRKWPY